MDILNSNTIINRECYIPFELIPVFYVCNLDSFLYIISKSIRLNDDLEFCFKINFQSRMYVEEIHSSILIKIVN